MSQISCAKPPAEHDPAAAIRLAERLLDETRDEVRRADAKAVQWLATLGAGAVAVVSWSTRAEPPWARGGPAAWLTVLGCVCAIVATAALTSALVPRMGGSSDPRHLAYFGHVYRIGDPV